MISRIWKEEKNTVIGLFISVLAGMLLITTIWKNDYTEDIPFGILDEDRSSLSQSIVKQFGINPSLDIVYYADSEQDLKQAILDKKIEAGVMIPENFSRDMSLKKSPQAVIFADCSNIITGGGAVGAASSVLGTMSAGMQLKMLEGNNFYPSAAQTSLGTFSYVDRTLYEPQGDYIKENELSAGSRHHHADLSHLYFLSAHDTKKESSGSGYPGKAEGGIKRRNHQDGRGGGRRGGGPVRGAVCGGTV